MHKRFDAIHFLVGAIPLLLLLALLTPDNSANETQLWSQLAPIALFLAYVIVRPLKLGCEPVVLCRASAESHATVSVGEFRFFPILPFGCPVAWIPPRDLK